MSLYFRMCNAVLDHPCAVELGQSCGKGDRFQSQRVLVYIRLLICALVPSKEFRDYKALGKFFGLSEAQAQIVWDICIRYGVLRQAEYGYNAHDWLVDNNFVGRYEYADRSTRAFNRAIGG